MPFIINTYSIIQLPRLEFVTMTVAVLIMTFNFKPNTSKCIGIALSPISIYVKNMKAVCQNLLKLSCQKESVDKVQFVTLTFDPEEMGIFVSPSCIFVLNMKTVLKNTQVIVSEPRRWQSSVVILTFEPKIYMYLPLTILYLCMKYERCTFKITPAIV